MLVLGAGGLLVIGAERRVFSFGYGRTTIIEITSAGDILQNGHSGLVRYWPGTEAYLLTDPKVVPSPHAINEHGNGDIYVGGYGTGFMRIRNRVPERLNGGSWDATVRVMPGSYRTAAGELLFINENTDEPLLRVDKQGQLHIKTLPTTRSLPTGFLYRVVGLPDGAPILRGAPGGQFLALAMSQSTAEPEDDKGRIGFTRLPYAPDNPWYVIGKERGIGVRNVLTLAQDRKGNIWFGHGSTGVGVYSPARDTAVTYLSERPDDPGAIAMHIDGEDRLWMGSLRGLRYVDSISTLGPFTVPLPTPAPYDSAWHLRSRQKMVDVQRIPDNYVPGILQTGDTLIVSHTGGVSFIDLTSEDLTHPGAVTLPTAEYLGPSEQNALLLDQEGWLWVVGDEGIARLDFRTILRERRCNGTVEIAVRGDEPGNDFRNQEQVRIPVGDRSLSYGYELSVFDQLRDELRTNMLLTQHRTGDTVLYSPGLSGGVQQKINYLQPGTYELLTEVFQHNELVQTQRTEIKIPKQPYEFWWFWPVVALGITLPILLVSRLRYVRTKAELEASELRGMRDRLQVSTLSNAVNPHFISNAIMWLQSAYLVGRPMERMDEMAENLSQTIRTMFTNSTDGRASHPLAEELELVERYLRTVNLQYDERYDFQLPREAVRQDFAGYEVLLMQIQVHVENAIEHGLRSRRSARRMVVRLEREGDDLLIHVEDDGAGIAFVRARQAQRDYRPGRGTHTMRLLQDTFNRYNSRPLTTAVTSPVYTDADGSGYGTRITVRVPKSYRYALESDRR